MGSRPNAAALSRSTFRRWWHYAFCRSCRKFGAPRLQHMPELIDWDDRYQVVMGPLAWVLACDPVEVKTYPPRHMSCRCAV